MKAAASRKKTKGSVRRGAAKPKSRSTSRTAKKKPSAKKQAASNKKRTTTKAKKRTTASKKRPVAKKKATRAVSKTKRARTPVRRARTSTPARATHPKAAPKKKSRQRIPSPLPTKHVAPERSSVPLRARSMPPTKENRKPLSTPAPRPPVALPEFSEGGVLLAITYSIRDGRRGEFFDLMRELKPLLTSIGGMDVSVYEDRSRPNYLMEVFRFKDEAEFTAFDDKFHKDRKIAAIYALLDDIVEAEKSDFKIFERRL